MRRHLAQSWRLAAAILVGLTVAGCGINNVPTLQERAKAVDG